MTTEDKIKKLEKTVKNPNLPENQRKTIQDKLDKLKNQEIKDSGSLKKLETERQEAQNNLEGFRELAQKTELNPLSKQAMKAIEDRIKELDTEIAQLKKDGKPQSWYPSPKPKIEVKDGKPERTQKANDKKESGGKVTNAKMESVLEDQLEDLELPYGKDMRKFYLEALCDEVCETLKGFNQDKTHPKKVTGFVGKWLTDENTKAKKAQKAKARAENTSNNYSEEKQALIEKLLKKHQEKEKARKERAKKQEEKPKPRPTFVIRDRTANVIATKAKIVLKNRIKKGNIKTDAEFDKTKKGLQEGSALVMKGINIIAKIMGGSVAGLDTSFKKRIHDLIADLEVEFEKQQEKKAKK